ncbi:hypothetical protein BDW75DRAFT_242902 [Aspergillus navahoensis]
MLWRSVHRTNSKGTTWYSSAVKCRVIDARGIESSFDLDRNGFIYRTHKPPLTPEEFTDAEKVEKVYLADCERVLRDEVRRSDSTGPVKLEGAKAGGLQLPVADFVHNGTVLFPSSSSTDKPHRSNGDFRHQTDLCIFSPEYAERLLGGRVQTLNLWRPINGPVENHPLAVCDGSSYDPPKLLEADTIREKYTGQMMHALYDPEMEWYYMSRQRDDEVLTFKSYDLRMGWRNMSHIQPSPFRTRSLGIM